MKKLTIGMTTFDNDPFICNLIYEIDEQIKLNNTILDNVDFILYDDKSSKKYFLEHIPDYITLKIGTVNSKTPATGRNYIIDNCSSEYLLFIDGDDILIRSIADLLKEVSSKKEDILFSEVVKIGADGQHIKTPFIYNDTLFSKETPQEVKEKLCVHQTGVWSIYKTSFLKTTNIRYKLDMRYEDNYFLYSLLLKNPDVGIITKPYYGWRNNYESFSYTADSLKHRVFLYKKVMEKLKYNLDNKFAPYILFSIWNQTYSNIIRNYPDLNTEETKLFFNALEKVTMKHEKEIKVLKKAVDKKYVDKYFIYSESKMFKGFLKIRLLKLYKKVRTNQVTIKKEITKLFTLLPINNNKVFFMSQYGEYGSNPKYYYKELKNKDINKKVVFLVKDKELLKNKDFKYYDNRLLFYYHFYTAKDIYFDTWLDPTLKKRVKQNWTQMWHGYPYKKIYTDIEIYKAVNSLSKREQKEENILNWDNIYSLNSDNTRIFQNLFPSTNIIERDYPRITWLKHNKDNEELKSFIKRKYNLDEKCKYTLYAPTYRPYKVYLDLKEIMNLKSNDNELIYHPHPMLNSSFEFKGKKLTNVDIQEILLIIDELITDYSSIKYDFLQVNENSKIKEYIPDEELYTKVHGIY